ncbi:reverse transcriptase-like protein [Alkalihalobacillus pseudalcaliphilus]|uniref:reverse transcriptase-like protein n=1 Tax=Alkalihalobacillus pseudalcaliphilus TaxID=79884 RepID=UPI00064DB6C6|nr:reverse transcriptase-like protein [Alkalihalobacillus pseudalcaliphilus]KMK76569.1 hypothetical protein AB990_15490 [Alkalihalobacillus pseudalcaliphilus]
MKYVATWLYQIHKHHKSYKMTSEEMTLEEAIIFAADLEKSGKAKSIEWYDHADTYWTTKQLRKLKTVTDTEPTDIQAYFDAGFDQTSKQSGLGISIYYKQHHKNYRLRINQLLELLEDNNEAEYAAMYFLLDHLERLNIRHQTIHVYADSYVVIKQLGDEWPVYEEHYQKWHERIEKKASQLGITVHYHHIPREKNKEADKLASKALNNVQVEALSELTQD